MRVLIISHTAISRTGNMGKTLLSYFEKFHPGEVAQFYIHSEVPTDDSVCRNYYRFTDRDALKSLVPFRTYGRAFGPGEIQTDRMGSRTDTGFTGAVYQFGRKRTAGIFAARNALWKLARWDTKAFRDWVDDFAPDVIFFASGDYSFAYDIALAAADHTGKPLVVLCVDDFYLHNRNGHTALGRLTHRMFMKTVRRTMDRAAELFVISESMKREYEKLFGKKCRVLHTPARNKEVPRQIPGQVSYIGNLGLGRHQQLLEMGRSLKALDADCPRFIDVYSGERNPEILKTLTEENGIRFHGMISPAQVPEVMGRSLAVIHTESFDAETARIVRFSVSTKIAESMMYGPCLIAYGPAGIASVDYLKEHDAAFVISDPAGLGSGLERILTDAALRQRIVNNARALAAKNHNADTNSGNVRAWLEEAAGKQSH
ncbi:MAG: glycosyltransferase [Oscillospiraceae bacterium]|nr:glycosyltransferase [Oscillospiraceae bacterium]